MSKENQLQLCEKAVVKARAGMRGLLCRERVVAKGSLAKEELAPGRSDVEGEVRGHSRHNTVQGHLDS